MSAPQSGGEYRVVQEQQMDWKTVEELLQGCGVLQGHRVMTLNLIMSTVLHLIMSMAHNLIIGTIINLVMSTCT